MSAVRTLNELQDALSREFSWRKKELIGLKTLVMNNETTARRDLFIRAAVTLLYAHWEGFVRQIGRYYLEYVARRRLKHAELSQNFLAMAIGRIVQKASSGRRIQPSIDLVSFFQNAMDSRCDLPWENTINTRSNLKSEVFREIVTSLGLDYSRFETKEKLIDEKLLENRNGIAHGQYLLVGFDEYLALHEEIFGIMQDFYNQVDNAASLASYRNSASAAPATTPE